MCFLVGQIDAFHMVFDIERDAREVLIFPAGSIFVEGMLYSKNPCTTADVSMERKVLKCPSHDQACTISSYARI